jgi:HAMP domain-containing protein
MKPSAATPLSATQRALQRMAIAVTAIFMLLACVLFMWFARDLLDSFHEEFNVWNEYRSYGLVRTLGAELMQELDEHKESNQHHDHDSYKKILNTLWATHSEVVDLLLLDTQNTLLAQAGSRPQQMLQLQQQGRLIPEFNYHDLNYNNDAYLKVINGVAQNDNSVFYAGFIALKIPEGGHLNLVVSYRPINVAPPEPTIYLLCFSLVLVLGLLVWQIMQYLLARWYHEPLDQIHHWARDMAAGRWPAVVYQAHYQPATSIEKLAYLGMVRCKSVCEFLQWQRQQLNIQLPDATQSGQHWGASLPQSDLLRLVASQGGEPLISFASFRWWFFLYVVISVLLLLLPGPYSLVWPLCCWFVCMAGLFIAMPQAWVARSVWVLFQGGVVGFALGSLVFFGLSELHFVLAGSATLLVYAGCVVGYAWVFGFLLKVRKIWP